MASDDPIVPGEYGTSGLKKRPGKKLSDEQRAQRLVQMHEQQRLKPLREAERSAQIAANPLGNLNRLTRREFEVISRFMADAKLGIRALSKQMGYADDRCIHRILKKPHVQQAIAAIRAGMVQRMLDGDFGAQATLKAAQTKAATKVVETITKAEAGPKLNLLAAESVLDRTGLGRSSTSIQHHIHEILGHFTPEELEIYGNGGPAPERFAAVFKQLEGPDAFAPKP